MSTSASKSYGNRGKTHGSEPQPYWRKRRGVTRKCIRSNTIASTTEILLNCFKSSFQWFDLKIEKWNFFKDFHCLFKCMKLFLQCNTTSVFKEDWKYFSYLSTLSLRKNILFTGALIAGTNQHFSAIAVEVKRIACFNFYYISGSNISSLKV